MQECKKCGASWNLKNTLNSCPFCGEDLRKKQNVDSIGEAYSIILDNHGIDVFKNNVLIGLLGDYAPSLIKERKLIKNAIESGAYKAIIESSDSDRLSVFKRYISILEETYFLDTKWATTVLLWCMRVIDKDFVLEDNDLCENGSKDYEELKFNSINNQVTKENSDGLVSSTKRNGIRNLLKLPNAIQELGSKVFSSQNKGGNDLVADNNRNSKQVEIITTKKPNVVEEPTFSLQKIDKKDNNNLESEDILSPNFIVEKGVLKKYTGDDSFVEIPSSIYKIGPKAFSVNQSLCEIVIPGSVKQIESSAFSNCVNLKIVTISNGVKDIREWAFVNCKSLKQCFLPTGLENIGKFAFQGCSSLSTIQLPDSITEIQQGVFWGCTNLVNIVFPKNLRIIKKSSFKECKSLNSLILPSLLTTIEEGAFSSCWGLKNITITSDLMIDDTMFDGSSSSNKVEIKYIRKVAEKADSILDEKLYISSLNDIPTRTERLKKWGKVVSVVIDDSIQELPMEAFSEMSNLQSVVLSQNLKRIGYAAFKDCYKLNNVIIPDTVTTISAHSFENCGSLKSIAIPDSVKYIGDDAFRGCAFDYVYTSSDCVICNGNYHVKNK